MFYLLLVSYSFIKLGLSITYEVYWKQLNELAIKHQRLISQSKPVLLHDKAHPDILHMTKLQELKL